MKVERSFQRLIRRFWKGASGNGATRLALKLTKDGAESFGPLKAVVGILSTLLEQADQLASNEEDIKRILRRTDDLNQKLGEKSLEKSFPDEVQRRETLKRKVKDIVFRIESLSGKGNKFTKYLSAAENKSTILAAVEDLREAIDEYDGALQEDIYRKICKAIDEGEIEKLRRIPHAKQASYDSGNRQRCLKGTRSLVLQKIETWLEKSGNRIYWLNGHAGSGKSTLAQTFCERAFAQGKLGASFFCSRDSQDQSDPQLIFPTLAFQLAYRYSSFRTALLEVLKKFPVSVISTASLSHQLSRLLIEPLKALNLSTVIVIDAIDECRSDEKTHQSQFQLLSALAKEVHHVPLVKFFLTGRPEQSLREGFRQKPLHDITEIFRLHNVDGEDVSNDIRLLFETRLKEFRAARSDFAINEQWPLEADLNVLVLKAAGLFIFATTALKFITDPSPTNNPRESLRLITSLPADTLNEGRSGLDMLYTQILQSAFITADPSNTSFFGPFKRVLGAVVATTKPTSCAILADVLELDSPNGVRRLLRAMHSLLLVPDTNDRDICLFHKSFADYLIDRRRCSDSRFCVDVLEHKADLAIGCLQTMSKKIKPDVIQSTNILRRGKEKYSMHHVAPFTYAQDNVSLSYALDTGFSYICDSFSILVREKGDSFYDLIRNVVCDRWASILFAILPKRADLYMHPLFSTLHLPDEPVAAQSPTGGSPILRFHDILESAKVSPKHFGLLYFFGLHRAYTTSMPVQHRRPGSYWYLDVHLSQRRLSLEPTRLSSSSSLHISDASNKDE